MDFLIELIKKDPTEAPAPGARESNEETIMFALNMIHTGVGVWNRVPGFLSFPSCVSFRPYAQ